MNPRMSSITIICILTIGFLAGPWGSSDGLSNERETGRLKEILQGKKNDCGPAALKMVFDYYKILLSQEQISSRILKNRTTNMFDIKRLAEAEGLTVYACRIPLDQLKQAFVPAIIHLKSNHYIVLESVLKDKVRVLDPVKGCLTIPFKYLKKIGSGKILIFRKGQPNCFKKQ